MPLVTSMCLTESAGGAWGNIYDNDDPFEEGDKRRQEEDLVFSKDNEGASVIDFDAYEHIPVSNKYSMLCMLLYLCESGKKNVLGSIWRRLCYKLLCARCWITWKKTNHIFLQTAKESTASGRLRHRTLPRYICAVQCSS